MQVEESSVPLHDKQRDQKRIVALLAEESQVSAADVAILYEHVRAELALDARVTSFLHVFAMRNVREILRRHDADKHPVSSELPALHED
jgi:hypothetical protein